MHTNLIPTAVVGNHTTNQEDSIMGGLPIIMLGRTTNPHSPLHTHSQLSNLSNLTNLTHLSNTHTVAQQIIQAVVMLLGGGLVDLL
jgi:hypothetical protein